MIARGLMATCLLAHTSLAIAQPVQQSVSDESPEYEIDGRISSTATVYTESASSEAVEGNELASPQDLMFSDLRARLSVARDDELGPKALADFRMRLTGDELGARGYTGGSEYHLRRGYVEHRGARLRYAVGRQVIGEADAVRVDGVSAHFDDGGIWRYGAFAGAFPNPFSRSVETDYAGLTSAARIPITGGAHASYKTPSAYGSLAAATIAPRDQDAESPDPVRVFLAANGYTRVSPDIDLIHHVVVDLTGSGGTQLLSAQGTANWRPSKRLRLHLGATRMSTYAVEIYVRDLLEAEDVEADAGAPVQNNLALIRIGNTELRAGANLKLGARTDVFAHVRGRQRSALAATELPLEIAALEEENQLDVGGGVRRRDVLANVELGARATFIAGTRTRSTFANLTARRSWLGSRVMSELVLDLVRFRDNCGDGDLACTGSSAGTTVRGGGTLIYRTRHILVLADYRAARIWSRASGMEQPRITSHSILGRAQYSF